MMELATIRQVCALAALTERKYKYCPERLKFRAVFLEDFKNHFLRIILQ